MLASAIDPTTLGPDAPAAPLAPTTLGPDAVDSGEAAARPEGEPPTSEALVRTLAADMLATARRILAAPGGEHERAAVEAVREAFVAVLGEPVPSHDVASLARRLCHATVREAAARCPRAAYEASIEAWLPTFDAEGHRTGAGTVAAALPWALERLGAPQVRALVGMLPRTHRLVLVARDVEGLSVEDTADALGLDPADVAPRLHEARMALRHLLEQRLGA
jgi:DNA-directed RNA polymerase specialized sigma24 family protein